MASPTLAKTKKNLLPRSATDVAAIREELDEVGRISAQFLRARRQDSDITQAQMGYALGVSEDVISKYEALVRPIPLEYSIVWARLTGMEPREYFEELQFKLRKLYPQKR